MADSGGYWLNLAEAQKLTQAVLVPGIIEENIRRGGILERLPVMQVKGQSLDWNRENAERLARTAAVGDTLTWSDDITYTQKSVSLISVYDQTPLNHYVESTYGNINNYEAIVLRGLRKGLLRKLNDLTIYGDVTYNTNEFDGLHAWAQDGSSDVNIDEGEGALSLTNMRTLADAMKYDFDFWLMPYAIARRISAFYQEGNTGSTNISLGTFIWAPNEAGVVVPWFSGKPIIRSDWMVAEQANTGVGSDARAKRTSGTNQFSIFAVKMGQVAERDPGITMVFGGEKHDMGEFFRLVRFENLEDFDAAGLRLVSYPAMAAGSTFSAGRIYDITDASVTE